LPTAAITSERVKRECRIRNGPRRLTDNPVWPHSVLGADIALSDGRYLPRPKSSNGWFMRAVKAAGQAMRPDDLRHTCASLAVSAGVNVLALQTQAEAHVSKDDSGTYADLFDDDLDAVAVTLHARQFTGSVPKMCHRTFRKGGRQPKNRHSPV
jgi:integrase